MKPQVYLVGGAVRDAVMGETHSDKDYVAVGYSLEHFENLGYQQVGIDFPVFLTPEGEELALARRERKIHTGYQGFQTDIVKVTLEEDLERRDLTINSMAKHPTTGAIIDPYDGLKDIKDKFLRHTSSAFVEDPIRVLRLARFRARFPNFRIHKDTRALVYTMREELKSLQRDRVWKETEKALNTPYAHLYFEALHEMGLLNVVSPHLYELLMLKEGNKSHLEASVFEHTMQMLKLNNNAPITLKLAILFHDIAKPHCYKTVGDSSGHDSIELIIPRVTETFNLPTRIKREVEFLCENHVRIYKFHEMQPKSIAKFLAKYKYPYLIDYQIKLGQADDQGRITISEQKDIDPIKIWKCFWAIHKYSPKEWIDAQEVPPTGSSIRNHIHHHNINCVKLHYKD